MPTTFSLHNPTPGLHWYVSKPLGTDQIAAIRDPQGGQTVKQATSIPSPFARMDLVRSAFLNLALKPDLSGTMNDQRVVSDALDVGELFFNYDKLKTYVTITPFDISTDLERLRQSGSQGHKRLGDALKLFLDQDAPEYNFNAINRLFVLSYRGRVVGGTSPKTLFFSSGNDLSWVDVSMGNDRLFDHSVCPLHQRDIEYQKFWYAIKLFMPDFRDRFREVDDYLNRSRALLQQQNPTLFYEHIESPNGQPLLTREKFDQDFDELTTGPGDIVEVLGFPLRKKKSDARAIDQVSDFIIKSDKYARLNPGQPRPMALQNRFFRQFTYVPQAQWNSNTSIPYFARESWRDNQRPLPGQPGNYPWLTVSDLLEPYLIRLPFPTDRGRFFDGNLQTSATDKGFLLPLKKDFFDFFDVEDLLNGRVRLKMTPQGGGINVSLDIPVTAPNQPGNQFVTFERLYSPSVGTSTAPNEVTNEGIIIENSFTVNIYPFVRSGAVTVPADYRVQLIESGFDSQNQYELSYFGQLNNTELKPESKHQRTVRQQNTDGSSVYYVLRQEFDYMQTHIRADGRDMNGLLIPRWQLYNGGSKQFSFSVDFGTTNTHIEYSVDGQTPRPFDVAELTPQVATLVAPAQYNPALFELFLLYDLEFVPPTIGPGRPDNFPTRTAIAEPMNLSFNQQTQALADFNIPFYVERQPAGSNRITTNLKWAKTSDQTERRVEAFLEELLMLIKNKVLTEGGNLTQTIVYWFFPASMTPGRVSQLRSDWQELYDRYIGGAPGRLREVSESVAPFYYYKQNPTLSASARPVINVDIGGGTSDVVVYERNEPKLLTSFRFAGNAIYGDAFSEYGAASHNGFVRKYADKIQTLLASQSLGNLSDNNRRILETNRSEDIMAFWFSIERSNDVKAKSMLSFNGMLSKDEDLKVVFVLFYTALIYHIARLMKHKGISLPGAITFSGTGSKLLTIISSDDQMLGKLARAIFEKVYEPATYDTSGLTLFYERKGPKEVTCKGALMQPANSRPVDTEAISYIYPATFNDEFPTLTYADLRKPEVVESLLKETNAFIDFFFALNQQFSFVRNLNVSARSLAIAQQELRTHLDTSLMDGIQRKEGDVAAEYSGMTDALGAPIEETLFFYPLIGAINKLANALA